MTGSITFCLEKITRKTEQLLTKTVPPEAGNKVADDDLEQVGGGKLFDVFTTEFREFFDRTDNQNNPTEPENESLYGVNTLEMRINPKKKTERNNLDVIKL